MIFVVDGMMCTVFVDAQMEVLSCLRLLSKTALLATSSRESLFFPFLFSATIFSSNPRSVAVLHARQLVLEIVEHVEVVVVGQDRKVKMLLQ
jgi:hypothetical protein